MLTIVILNFLIGFYFMIRYQQNQYIISRYLRKSFSVGIIIILVVITLWQIFFSKVLWLWLVIGYFFIILRPKNYKKYFVLTKRMIRFIVVFATLIIFTTLFTKLSSILVPLLLVVAHFFIMPLELTFKKLYMKKAREKLVNSHAKVIGITGSYGKTSVKNLVNDVISEQKYTLATPKSFNTPVGVSMTINNSLKNIHEIFISEMGAYVPGEIREVCQISKPDISIITAIGYSHLETFKTRENILKTKFEIVEELNSGGLAILNADDELMMSYEIQNKCEVMTYGIDFESDVRAIDIKYDKRGCHFKIQYKNKLYDITTPLLGKHNIYNILATFCVALYLKLDMTKVITKVKFSKPVEHRMQIKEVADYTIIDDSFNSNPIGSSAALDVLAMMEGYRVIITPGMIELGECEDELNYQLGEKISKVCDYAILVGSKQTKALQKALKETGNFHVVKSFDEGFKLFKSLQEKDKILLIENDLPDLYNE